MFSLPALRPVALVAALLVLALSSVHAASAQSDEAQRIVVIGGSVTEIAHALGAQDRLVARDSTSLYPAEAAELPDIGYIRQLSPEGVLSVNPDMIIALEGYGPPEAVSVIQQSGIPLVEIPDGIDRPAIVEKIRATAKALGRVEGGERLAQTVEAKLEATEAAAASVKDKKKVLFVLSAAGGRIMAAGRGTHADGIITLAGGVNAISDFEGYKPLSNEAVIDAAPDLILRMRGGGDHSKDEEVLHHPAIALTPAGKAGAIRGMDGLYLLGFGPRTANAAADLAAMLYGGDDNQGN